MSLVCPRPTSSSLCRARTRAEDCALPREELMRRNTYSMCSHILSMIWSRNWLTFRACKVKEKLSICDQHPYFNSAKDLDSTGLDQSLPKASAQSWKDVKLIQTAKHQAIHQVFNPGDPRTSYQPFASSVHASAFKESPPTPRNKQKALSSLTPTLGGR